MLGFDVLYSNCADDAELARISDEQNRILLTRERDLLKRSAVTRGYWVRETDGRRQVETLIMRFDLAGAIHPFTRCLVCNELLRPASENEVHAQVPSRIREWCDKFQKCGRCGRVYWQGSHYRRMLRWIEELSGAHVDREQHQK
jgi:uncharacterized protein with PIN domain